jgi:DNA-binding GntR family transcriptional regulator
MALAPLRKKRATDEVYDALRNAILTRHFLPGQRLLADELTSQLDVGLVEIHPRSGTYVASISEEDLIETFEIRLALELLAGKRAIANWNPAAATNFDRLLKSLAKPVRNPAAMRQHEEWNLEFHFALFDLAGSKKLRDLYESLNSHIQIARIHASEGPTLPGLAPRLDQEQKEHEAIVAALAKQSLPQLEQALKQHILRAQDSLLETLRTRNGK